MKTPVVESMAMIWNFLFLPGFRSRRKQVIRLSELPSSSTHAELLVGPDVDLPVEVDLDGQLVLVREYDLPKSKPLKRDAMLKYNALAFAERLGEDVFHSESPASTGRHGTKFYQALVRKSDIDTIKSWLAERGRRLGRVTAKHGEHDYVLHEERQTLNGTSSLWWGVSLVASLALLGSNWVQSKSAYIEISDEIDRLGQQSFDLQTKIVTMNEETVAARREREIHSSVAQKAYAGAMLSVALERLTNTVPINTWIHQLEFSGDGFLIDGQTSSGLSEFIELLRSEPWIASAELRRANTRANNANGSTPFSIALTINWEGLS